MQTQTHVDADTRITDLVGRLKQDSKRLVTDEVKLAKLEVSESAKHATRGMMWLAVGFGVWVIGLVAFTVFLTTIIGRVAGGHVYVGALVAGVLELAIGLWLVKRGAQALKKPPYTLDETRQELKETVSMLTRPRAD